MLDLEQNPAKVADVILQRLQQLLPDAAPVETGTVVSVGDGVARVYGLGNALAGELVSFPRGGLSGIILNLDEDGAGVVVLGSDAQVRAGDEVRRSGEVVEVPVGDSLRGRVLNALGQPIDGRGPLGYDSLRHVEYPAPGVKDRQPVREPLETGIKAVDMLIPIGRGQRELIIGDRETGKTALALDAIINQKGKGVYCVYVGIGQRLSSLARLSRTLEENGAAEYTTIVAAPAEEPPALQYLAPFAGCAMAEHVMYSGGHALIVYDDLSRHAVAYRAMSLLLRRPPGREAYPGDIFFLHARLLERSAKLSDEHGGGSMTALPIVTTLAGDISAYIPTNIISITDGQIYLESELFFAGVRPAINIGLSVSRVGGAAQPTAVRRTAGRLRLDLAQYRELAAFSRFAQELDESTRARLLRGERVVEVLKQPRYEPVPMPEQVAVVYAAVNGYLDDVPPGRVKQFEKALLGHLRAEYAALLSRIRNEDWSDEVEHGLREAIERYSRSLTPSLEQGDPAHEP